MRKNNSANICEVGDLWFTPQTLMINGLLNVIPHFLSNFLKTFIPLMKHRKCIVCFTFFESLNFKPMLPKLFHILNPWLRVLSFGRSVFICISHVVSYLLPINPGAQLNLDITCLYKQWRFRSVGFWRSQLIWSALFVIKYVKLLQWSTVWIK